MGKKTKIVGFSVGAEYKHFSGNVAELITIEKYPDQFPYEIRWMCGPRSGQTEHCSEREMHEDFASAVS
jgi:hypothetical protein